MRLKLRHGAQPRKIALLHAKLGYAVKLLHETTNIEDARHRGCIMNAPSMDALHRMADSLRAAMLSLEDPFLLATDRNAAPLSHSEEPDEWLRWLDEREKSAETAPAQF